MIASVVAPTELTLKMWRSVCTPRLSRSE